MALSNDIISQFVELTNTSNKIQNEASVYGTIVTDGENTYVKLDGSEQLTPIETTTNVSGGERVIVRIKDHKATVTGNITSPSVNNGQLEDVKDQISEFEVVIADRVTANEIVVGRIEADNVIINKKLTAIEGEFETIKADNITINEKLTANKAAIADLDAKKLSAETADLKYATIGGLNAANAEINDLKANHAEFSEATIKRLEADEASIKKLDAEKLSVKDADIKYANIDFANINMAAVEKLFAESGIIKDLVVGDTSITGELVGVTIKGDLIEANTLVADKLVIKGSDGLYYKLNTDGMTTEAEQTEYNSLNGSIITAKSITATKISVDDLVAFDATIGGFNISSNSIYSGVKSSVDNTTKGIYLDKDGQIAFGDANNFLKFFRDTDGKWKLNISANSLKFSTSDKTVEEVIEDIDIKVQKTVKTVVDYYASSSSSTTKPTTGWQTTPPEWVNGKFIWVKTKTTYTDGTSFESEPACITGAKGDTGEPGADGTSGVGISSVDVEYYLSTSSTTLAGGSWSTNAPTWVDGKYMWSRTKTTTTDGKSTISDPVCITGGKGSTGSNGSVGQGVESITEEYYLSTSKTTQSGGSWVTTPPTWSSGKYLWTRSKIVYKNPTETSYTTPVCDNSWEAVNKIEIGGRNLFVSSMIGSYVGGNIVKLRGATYENYKFTVTSNPVDLVGATITNFEKELVVSGYTDLSQIVSYWKFDNDTQKNVTKSVTNGKFEIRISVPSGAKTLNIGLGQFPYVKGYFIKNIMIQNGNKATDWTPSPEDVDNKIDSIEIGGANLFKGSSSEYVNLTIAQFNGAIAARRHCSEYGLKAGDTITFGVDIKSMSSKPLRARIDFYSNATGEDGKTSNYSSITIPAGREGRSYITAIIPSGKEYIFPMISNADSSIATSTIEKYKCAMLEKGNKPSAWSPNPDDLKDFSTEEAKKVETRVTEKVTDVTKTVDGIKEEIKSTTNKITTITKDLSTVETLAKAMSNGKSLKTDPVFRKGTNGVTLYNNADNGNVTLTRITKPSDCPTTSTHCLQYKCIGTAAPNLGGFIVNVASRANAKFVIRVIAKIPVGYTISTASNSMGTGYADKIITDNTGTGNYQEYIRLIQCGSTGSFSNGGHFFISGATPTSASPIYVDIASVELYDITDSDERLNELTTSLSENTQKIAEVDKKADSISNRVKTTEENISSVNNNVVAQEKRLASAETKLTDSNFAVQIQRNQNKVYRFRYIRDYISGSTVNTANHWIEIKAINNLGVNVAKDKTVSGSGITNVSFITDGNTTGSYASGGGGLQYVQVDLGTIYEDIDCLKIWHYYSDNRTYHGSKTQISIDGTNWTTVFDSTVSGEYKETQYGHTIKLNDTGEHNSMMDFSENGLRVSHTDANLDTIMDTEGFYIVPEGKDKEYAIASFAGNSSYQTNLNVGSVEISDDFSVSGQLIYSSKGGHTSIYVSPNGFDEDTYNGKECGYSKELPFKSLDYAVSKIPKNIPQGSDYSLIISGTFIEPLFLSNFVVGGMLDVLLDSNCQLEGGINAYSCYGNVRITTLNDVASGCTQTIHHVYAQHCQLRFEGQPNTLLRFGSYNVAENAIHTAVKVYHCEILFDRCDFGKSIRYAWWGTRSTLWHKNCVGNTESCFVAEYGCRIMCIDNGSTCYFPVTTNYKYYILRYGSTSVMEFSAAKYFPSNWQPASAVTPPTPAIKTYTTTWTVTSVETYVPALGTYESGKCRQGWYASNRGNYVGMAKFNIASIKATLSGSTITASSVTVTRENSSHGYNSPQTVYVVGKLGRTRKSAYASKSGFNRGTTQTISCGVALGNNLRDGVVDGLAFYAPNANTQYEDYVVIAPTTIKITITYKK